MCKKMTYLITFVLVLGLATGVESADPFEQDPGSDGIVSIEAENFDDNILKGASYWEFVTSTVVFTPADGFSGGGAMQSMPDTLLGGGAGFDTGYGENAPRLDYQVNFTKTGTHYVWIFAYGMDGNSDSCHAGLDGEETPLSNRMSGWSNSYNWDNDRYERPERSQIDITTAGLHVLNIFVREDGLTVDKIVLTTNPNYTPTGKGPPESHRGLRLKAYNPSPEDSILYEDTWVSLSWSAGETAVSHDVYFGENFGDVNDSTGDTFQGNQAGAFFVVGFPGFPFPDGLVTGTTYYWRIDEVEADGTTKHKGDVWDFTIPPRRAYDPIPADDTQFIDPNTDLSWSAGLGSKLHHVYFGDNFDDVNAGTPETYKGPIADTTYSPGTLALDKVYYWRVDEFAIPNTYTGDVWSFTTTHEIPITNPNLVGWWKLDEGFGAATLDYSGHGNHGTLQGNPQRVDGFDGDGLELDGTNSVELSTDLIGSDMGSVCMWIKTTQAETGMIFYGSSGTGGNGFGDENELHINMMSNGGVEFFIEGEPDDNDVNLEASAVNDDAWHHITATWEVNGFANLYVDGGAPVSAAHTGNDFVLSGRIRLGRPYALQSFYSGLIDDVRVYDYVLSPEEIAIIMRGDVTLAWNPKPVNGSKSNINDVRSVSWSPGDVASQHDVYFGTDKDAVDNADTSTAEIYRGQQGTASYTPPEGVEWGQTYYWRIDESNTDGTISKGRVWSFTVIDYIIVDDFESYNDLEPEDPESNRIYIAWLDGYDSPTNGSIVGYENPPFAEQTIVHGGKQSMPLYYDNSVGYSEAELTLTYPRDWTEEGVGVLSLWFRGRPAGFIEGPAGTYTMTATGVDIWDQADEFRYAYKQLSGAGSISAQVLSVDNTNPWAKCGVMIRQTLETGSKFAALYITPGNGCRFQGRLTPGSATSDTPVATAEQMAITAPYWVKIERDAAGNFNGYYSSDGVSWQAMAWNPQRISMPSDVYIGLVLTSHNPDEVGKAEFSNVQTTGTVTPTTWMQEAIGVPMASNDSEPMYVALNGSAVVFHDNPNAALIDTWTQWNIDLQAFADQGVNLANVNTIAIGFGDKKNPQPGGSGTAYFDDIRLHR
jgi:hypothetical protein